MTESDSPLKKDYYITICAIDFGTTFSGYAFSTKNDPKTISVNKNWAGGFQVKKNRFVNSKSHSMHNMYILPIT